MLEYLYHILESFRPVFSRQISWLKFCSLVLGLIGGSHLSGVSSICRFWRLNEAGYMSLLHFFRSSAWKTSDLMEHWQRLVLSQGCAIKKDGRHALIGDDTVIPKDGRHMPGVVTLHQDSETQTKPSYFRGHFWGVLGMLVGSGSEMFCLPIQAELHQGQAHLNQIMPKGSTALRPVQMALNFAVSQKCPSYLVLDAFFSLAPVFELASSICSITLKAPLVSLVVKGKKNYVAYHPAQKTGRRGRPRKYGEKVELMRRFEQSEGFEQALCSIYGREETVSFLALNLLWKPLKGMLRFILVESSRGRMILSAAVAIRKPFGQRLPHVQRPGD